MEFENKGKWQSQISESIQVNEAKLDKATTIDFDNVGAKLEVILTMISDRHGGGYGLWCKGNNSEQNKRLLFVNKDLQSDEQASLDITKKESFAIAKDIKSLSDKFDKDIEAIFAKHGFTKI